MQIIEIKNNLVKVIYNPAEENIVLSGFVIVRDETQAFIGQIVNLEAQNSNTAIIKLLFTFDAEGVISNYNGSAPAMHSQINIVFAREILELFPAQNPIYMGEVAQQGDNLVLDKNIFDQKTVICTEKQEEKDLLINNFVYQLVTQGNKVLLIDTLGNTDYPEDTLIAGKDFKLPLDYDTINFIYEKGLDDASGETKATIQEVFLEVQNYVKTLPEKFIPFENFKNVVDAQYEELELVELLLLKNKLLKFYDEGIFAQEEVEFKSLQNHISECDLTVLNLSKVDENVQKEMISYAYSKIEEQEKPVYILINLDNENSDKKLLKQIYTAKKGISVVSCQYDFKYIKELKQLSKNVMMFAPIQQQNDFGGYNIFLNKLNNKEFVIYGESTHHIPFIIALKELPEQYHQGNQQSVQQGMPVQEPSQEATAEQVNINQEPIEPVYNEQILTEQPQQIIQEENLTEIEPQEPLKTHQEIVDEEIKKDVDEMFTAPAPPPLPPKDNIIEDDSELLGEELTDADLDFIQESFSDDALNGEPLSEIEPLPSIQEETFSNVMQQEAELQNTQSQEILPQEAASTPIVPVYSAEVEPDVSVQSDEVQQGDIVEHAKYGKGVVEKLISYGDKTLCSINFDNVGRRLLDPNVTEIKKI